MATWERIQVFLSKLDTIIKELKQVTDVYRHDIYVLDFAEKDALDRAYKMLSHLSKRRKIYLQRTYTAEVLEEGEKIVSQLLATKNTESSMEIGSMETWEKIEVLITKLQGIMEELKRLSDEYYDDFTVLDFRDDAVLRRVYVILQHIVASQKLDLERTWAEKIGRR